MNASGGISASTMETYRGVVQPWECDRNNHWNVRFYIRAFQMASEALAIAITGGHDDNASGVIQGVRLPC
jgi:acyl-CoA thioesterase FadM